MNARWTAGVCLLAGLVCAEPTAETEQLAQRVAQLQSDIARLQDQMAKLDQAAAPAAEGAAGGGSGWTLNTPLALSGQGAIAYFDTGARGGAPNREFRLDEARLFLDARLAETVFLYTELNYTEREDDNTDVRVGEIFLEFADLGEATLGEWAPTVRAGRLQIPVGEEYARRYAKDDPLISHSLADLWGVDEGVSLFGDRGRFDYVVAVQNGGYEKLKDGDPDKSVAARVGWTEGRLRLSASAFRSGDINVIEDECAELWFGNAFLTALGDIAATRVFDIELAQLDARWTWAGGSVGAFGGTLAYDDDDTTDDNARDAWYGALEVVQDFAPRWYGAARYSWIRCSDGGYRVLGQGGYNPDVAATLADEIDRLSLGVGCRLNPQVTLKGEYSRERGEWTAGGDIRDRDQVAAQAVYAF